MQIRRIVNLSFLQSVVASAVVAILVELIKAFWPLLSSPDTFNTIDSIQEALKASFLLWLILIVLYRSIGWLYRTKQYAFLAKRAGLNFHLPNNFTEDRKETEATIAKDIDNNRDIKILGATGFKTFGSPDSFLYNAIQNAQGIVEVILLDPDIHNIATRERAASLGVSHEDYRREIVDTVRRLQILRNQGKNIILMFYQHLPLWKLYIAGENIWVQHYHSNEHVATSDAFGFKHDIKNKNFYDFFSNTYNRLASHLRDNNKIINLDRWQPPNDIA